MVPAKKRYLPDDNSAPWLMALLGVAFGLAIWRFFPFNLLLGPFCAFILYGGLRDIFRRRECLTLSAIGRGLFSFACILLGILVTPWFHQILNRFFLPSDSQTFLKDEETPYPVLCFVVVGCIGLAGLLLAHLAVMLDQKNPASAGP